jgi:hypothetical protein
MAPTPASGTSARRSARQAGPALPQPCCSRREVSAHGVAQPLLMPRPGTFAGSSPQLPPLTPDRGNPPLPGLTGFGLQLQSDAEEGYGSATTVEQQDAYIGRLPSGSGQADRDLHNPGQFRGDLAPAERAEAPPSSHRFVSMSGQACHRFEVWLQHHRAAGS